MARREGEEHQGFTRFHACIGPLGEKEVPEARRILCACFLARNMIWPLLGEQESRDAIETAEKYAVGGADRKMLLKARKNAKAAAERAPIGFLKQAAEVAMNVTWTPCGWTHLRGIAATIANLLANKSQHDNPGLTWESYLQAEQDFYFAMADFALKFQGLTSIAATQVKSLLDDPHLRKYHRRHFNPYDTRDHVILNAKDERRKKQVLDAFQCFLDNGARSEFLVQDLGPIKLLCESATRQDRDVGIELLISLGAHHSSARDVLFGLLESPKSEIRFTAISHFGFFHLPYPSEFVIRMIEKAIEDASSKVRRFASQAAADYSDIKETVPLLERRLDTETNEEVRKGLEYDLPMLRDGYRVEKRADGMYSVSVKTKQGISCLDLAEKDLEPMRFKTIIEKVRSGEFQTSGIIGYDSGAES